METYGTNGETDWMMIVMYSLMPLAITILKFYLLFLLGRGLYHKKTWAYWTAGVLLVLIIALVAAAYWFFSLLSNTNWSL